MFCWRWYSNALIDDSCSEREIDENRVVRFQTKNVPSGLAIIHYMELCLGNLFTLLLLLSISANPDNLFHFLIENSKYSSSIKVLPARVSTRPIVQSSNVLQRQTWTRLLYEGLVKKSTLVWGTLDCPESCTVVVVHSFTIFSTSLSHHFVDLILRCHRASCLCH